MSALRASRAGLAAILGVGALVRLYRIDLTWYFLDQVRDVSTAAALAAGQAFPLVGPLVGWTSARLGPLYFYLIAPPFLLSGDPLAGVVYAALAGVLTIALLYRLASETFGVRVALAACALFAVFPLAVQSSRVLWNPAFVPLFTVLFMQALYRVVVGGRSRAIIGVIAWLGVLTQLHLSSVPLVLVAVLALLAWRPRVRPIHVAAGAAVLAALYAPYLLHEATHRFENTRAFLGAATGGEGPRGERALLAVMGNLLALDRDVLAGFVVTAPWPRGYLRAFSVLYGVEAALFGLGLFLCLAWLVGRPAGMPGAPAPGRRPLGLLLLWLAVPVIWLGTRRTALWWYYFDVLYPSQFIVAGIAISWIAAAGPVPARVRHLVARATAGLVLAIVAVQAWFTVGLARRIEAQGQIVLEVPRLSVAAAPSALGTLSFLPYAYRERILRALVEGFGLDARAVAARVHGAVLGLPEESDYLLRRMHPAGPAAGEAKAHYLVLGEGDAAPLAPTRSARVGPFRIVAYRPAVDYGDWSMARLPGAGVDLPAEGWERRGLPAADAAALRDGQALAWRGSFRASPDEPARLVVTLIGDAPLEVARVDSGAGVARLVRQRSWQSPSLYWTTQALVEVPPASGSDRGSLAFVVAGAGRVRRVDVHEVSSPPGAAAPRKSRPV